MASHSPGDVESETDGWSGGALLNAPASTFNSVGGSQHNLNSPIILNFNLNLSFTLHLQQSTLMISIACVLFLDKRISICAAMSGPAKSTIGLVQYRHYNF